MNSAGRRAPGEGTPEWLPKTQPWRFKFTFDTLAGKKRKSFTHRTTILELDDRILSCLKEWRRWQLAGGAF